MAKTRAKIKRRAGEKLTSTRHLAAALGRSQTTIVEYLRDSRWKWSRKAPWSRKDLPAMRSWSGQLQEDRGAAGADLVEAAGGLGKAKTIAQIKVLVEREANLRVDRMVKEREYVKRAEHEEASAKKWESVKRTLMQVPRAMRQLLADTSDPGKVEEILTRALMAVCNEGFGGGSGQPG